MRARVLYDMDVKPSFEPADLARWSGGSWHREPVVPINGFSIDTRSLQPGNLFIAMKGEISDGHAFLAKAIAAGASAVMVDQAGSLQGLAAPAIVVPDTRKALMNLARGYRKTLSCRMVAVTGSVGKTTVKELIANMLHHVGVTARTRGNWNNDLGMPLSLLQAQPDTRYGVFEVGMNHPGELDPLCEVLHPDIGVITCIGPVHIEHFENETGIAREKAAVYRALGPDGIAVLNADDAKADLLRQEAAGKRLITVSSHNGSDYVYTRLDPARGTFQIREKSTGDIVDMMAALPGEYFITDAVLSAASARALGVGWPVIRDAIQHYQPLSMRWNRHLWFGIHTVNDAYNANPVSVRAAIKAFLEEPAGGRRWLVLAGMLELGADERRIHHELGAFIAQYPGLQLITVGTKGSWIAEGAANVNGYRAQVQAMPDTAAAARFLRDHLKAGDAVLFKASRGEAVEKVLREWIQLKEAQDERAGDEKGPA